MRYLRENASLILRLFEAVGIIVFVLSLALALKQGGISFAWTPLLIAAVGVSVTAHVAVTKLRRRIQT